MFDKSIIYVEKFVNFFVCFQKIINNFDCIIEIRFFVEIIICNTTRIWDIDENKNICILICWFIFFDFKTSSNCYFIFIWFCFAKNRNYYITTLIVSIYFFDNNNFLRDIMRFNALSFIWHLRNYLKNDY